MQFHRLFKIDTAIICNSSPGMCVAHKMVTKSLFTHSGSSRDPYNFYTKQFLHKMNYDVRKKIENVRSSITKYKEQANS